MLKANLSSTVIVLVGSAYGSNGASSDVERAGETMVDVVRTVDATRLAGWRPPALSSKARPPCEAAQTVAAGGSIQQDSGPPTT
jgi:hypothetical protein